LGTAAWEPAWLGAREGGKSSLQVLTQPTYQGFLYHNSLIGSSGRKEVKKLKDMSLFHISGETRCTGEPRSNHPSDSEGIQKKGSRGQATGERPYAMC